MNDSIEIVLDDGSNRVALWRNVFVQVRHGAQTMQSLDLLIGSWRMLKHRASGDLFGLFILEAGAEMAGAEVRKRQLAVLKEVFDAARLHRVIVIEGQGILADLKRVMARGLTDSRTKIFCDAREAAQALANRPGAPSVAELLAVVDAARNQSRPSSRRASELP
jgi:hypothetical protein